MNKKENQLYTYVRYNNIPGAIEILNTGVNPNFIISKSSSFLIFCVKSKDMAELLVDFGADINAKDITGKSALFYVENKEVAEYFTKKLDVNVKDIYDCTPLFYTKDIKIADVFISHGMNLNQKATAGYTELFWAETPEMIDYLVKKGSNINAQSVLGDTVGHLFVWNFNLLKSAIKNKLNINLKNNLGQTAIYNAIIGNKKNSFNLLIENGADINVMDKYNNTPSLYAKKNKCYEFYNLLTILKKEQNDKQNFSNLTPSNINTQRSTKIQRTLNQVIYDSTTEISYVKNNNFSYNNNVAATTSTFKIDYQTEQETTPFAKTAIAGTIGFAAGAVGVALAAYGTKKIYDKFCNTQSPQNITESLEMNDVGFRQNSELTKIVVYRPTPEETTKREQLNEAERMLQNAIKSFDNER